MRVAVALIIFTALFLSQRFWYRATWRATSRWSIAWLRTAVRFLYVFGLVLIILAHVDGFRIRHRGGHIVPRDAFLTISAGLWFSSAVFAFLAVKIVHIIDRLWTWLRKMTPNNSSTTQAPAEGISAEPGTRAKIVW